MILAVHILAGAAIAVKTQSPILGLSLAFFSHFLLDLFPHKEYQIKNIRTKQWSKSGLDLLKIFLDFFLGMLIILIMAGDLPRAIAGGLLGISADGLTFLSLVFPKIKPLESFCLLHKKLHWFKNKKIPLFWEVFSQTLIVFAAIYFL